MPQAELPDRILGVSWRNRVPALTGSVVVLRELQHRDALSLDEALSIEEVRSWLPPPFADGREGFLDLIERSHQQRFAGERVCFAAVPRGCDVAIGLFELHALESGFATAEWRFAIAPEFWGSGVFADGARLAIDFLFETVGAWRLEARAAVNNVRANAALMKIGAIREVLLRGRRTDQRASDVHALWTIHAEDWRRSGAVARVH